MEIEIVEEQLRLPTRKAVIQKMETLLTNVYRYNMANNMIEGEDEHPLLYNTNVLRKAKHEEVSSLYLDRGPIRALSLMKRSSIGRNVIRKIGLDPVSCTFISKENSVALAIDATGDITHVDGIKNSHLFLYQDVIRCSAGQFPISQMVTESHDTVSIST